MKIKNLLTLACLLLLFNAAGLSQDSPGQPDGSRIEALKIAYLTKKINLSPQEAQQFWPIYNNYAAELNAVRTGQRQNKSSELETEEKILDIRKKYNTEFAKALSAEKVNTFFRSEKDFSQFVQKELAERRQLQQLQNDQRPRK